MQRILSSTKKTILSTKRLNLEAGKLFQVQQVFFSVEKNDKQKDDKQIPTPSILPSPLPPDLTFKSIVTPSPLPTDVTFKSIVTVGISSFISVR